MDMYRILENFDAVNSKTTLVEGRMSVSAIDELYQEWVNSEDAPFDSDSGDQNAVLEKAMRFLNGRVRPEQIEDIADMLANHWHGGQGVMSEERRGDEELNEGLSPKIKKIINAYRNQFEKIYWDKDRKKIMMSGDKAFKKTCQQLGIDPDVMMDYLDQEYRYLHTPKSSEKYTSANYGDPDAPVATPATPAVVLTPKIKKIIKAYRKLYPTIAYDKNGEDIMEPEEAHDETSRRLGVDPSDMDDYLELFDEEVNEERRSEEDWDAQAIAQQKAKLAREKQKIMMQRKISGQDSGEPPVVRDMSEADMEEGNRFTGNLAKARAAGKTQADLDGDGDMEKVQEVFPGTPEYELRFGKDDASSAFDKKKISTGTVYSRRYKDEPESDDDAPKSAGRPKGTGRKLGAKGPSVASKLLKGKGGLKEHDIEIVDRGEYDQEGQMARQDLHTMVDAAKELHAILASDENLPEWVQSKITKALDYIDTARDYMKSVDAERSDQPVAEIAPVIGAIAGRALAGAAGAGSTGQALGGLAGRAVAGAMNSGDDEVAEGSPLGGFKVGDILKYKNTYGNIIDVEITRILPDGRLVIDGPGISYMKVDPTDRDIQPMKEDGVSEAGYSAKAARAGKDIGKPGKSFAKIAKGATERYGSKEAGERVAGAVLAKLRAKEGTEPVEEKAPPGAKAERMVKHIKSGYAKDGKLTDKEKAIAYATAWKAKKAGQVEEESSDKKDVPFDGPYRKKGDDKDQFGNKIKHVARHAARQGLADMTTAELKAELKRRSQVEEESTDTRDQHAEKAGKKVTKDLEYDMKHKGRDDAKAEKAGKKVTKDIEYDDKKDKKKEVEETTVSGSVAPAAGSDAPKKGKGGMQFGKGVYEGQVAESFEKKLGSILNEGMSVNVSTDDTGKKSISVNATDADADALGDMLKMAGLFSSEGYSRACADCGGIHEMGACGADMVEEELANSPDEVYTDADYMTQTLSGGLNGPKTTGQTTGPVVNRQDSRQGVMAEAERVKEQAESRLWNLYKKI